MPVYFGSNKTTPIYKGTTKIGKTYKGLNLVYQSGILPSGYTECEYLESTGTQYINTGVTINQNSKILSDISITQFNGNNYYMGARTPNVFGCSNTGNSLSRFVINVNGTFGTYINVSANTKYNIIMDLKNKNATSNGSTIQLPDYTTFTSENLFIFAYNGSGTATAYSYMRYYHFAVYNNDVLILNLIPCLDENLKPCMYDSVSKTTFYNQGTGEFLYKTSNYKIPDNYTLCEYLESTGTQYIDTNYYATNTSGINIDFAYTKSGNAGLCGIFQSQAPRTDTLFVTTLSGQTSTVIYLISQGGELTNNVVPQIGTKYNAKINYLNNRKLIINNTTTGNDGSNGVVSTRTIKLFCRDNGGSLAYTNARIYECILTTGNTIARYLVPCLDNNGVPCMYDLVNKTTYYNAGSGTFNYG